VFLFTRILGRRELSNLQPFDLMMLVVIGDLVQSGITQTDPSVTGVLIAIATIGIAQVGTSYLSFKFAACARCSRAAPSCWSRMAT
jgi:uncharacterized membrane protein YcaP (DUF421 family)